MSHLLSRHSSFHCVHYHGGGRREGGVFICYLLNNLCADIWHKLQQHTSQHILQLRLGHEIQSVTKHWELNIQEHGQLCLLRQCWTEGNFFLGIAVNHLDISWLILVESVFFVHTLLTKKSFSLLIRSPLFMDRGNPSYGTIHCALRVAGEQTRGTKTNNCNHTPIIHKLDLGYNYVLQKVHCAI